MADTNERPDAWSQADLADENALLRASMAEMRERLDELEDASTRDELTGLPNRPRLVAELDRVLATADRHGTPATLAFLDVEDLDEVRSRFGRPAADALLIHVAKLLRALVRSTDLVVRTEGGRFAIILDHLDHNSAIDAAERLQRCLAAQPLDLGQARLAPRTLAATAAILSGDTRDEVLRRADANARAARETR